MSEIEIERLIVRLTGNAVEYNAMLQKAVGDTAQAAKTVAESAARMAADFKGGLMSVAQTAGGMLAAFGLGNWLKSSFESFQKAETGLVRLSAAIQANGRDVESSVAGYRAFGSELARLTNTTMGQTLSMARVGESYGLTNEQVRQAISNSVALSGVLGGEAEDHMRIGIALVQGNVQMLRRIPALRGIHDETQMLARAQQLLTSGLALAQAEMNTTEGQVKRFWNTIAALKKEMGAVLAEALVPFIGYAQQIADWFKNLSAETKRWIGVAIGVVALVASFTALYSVIGLAVGSVWKMVTSIVTFLAQILLVIPATILWNVVTAAFKVVMFALNLVLGAGGAVLSLVLYVGKILLATVATVTFKAVMIAVNLVVALFNIALTAASGVGILFFISGIALAVVAIGTLVAAVGGVISIVASVGAAVWSGLQAVWDGITTTASAVGSAIGRAWEALTGFLNQVWQTVGPMFGRIREQFADFFGGAGGRQLANQAGNLGVTIGQSMGRGMHAGSQSFHAALQGSSEALSRMQAYQDRIAGPLGGNAATAASGPMQQVVNAGLNLWESMRVAATAVWAWIQERAGSVLEDIADYAADFWSGILTTVSDRWTEVSDFLQDTWREVRQTAIQVFLDLKALVADIQYRWLVFARVAIPFSGVTNAQIQQAGAVADQAEAAAAAFQDQPRPGQGVGGGEGWEESRTLSAVETRALLRQMRDFLAGMADEAGVPLEVVLQAAELG